MLKFKYGGSWDAGNYEGTYYMVAWPSATDKSRVVVNNNVHSCREFFVRSYRSLITNQNSSGFIKECRKAQGIYTTGRSYTKQYDSRKINIRSYAEKGLYIINSFEREHGWPRTKMYEVECENMLLPAIFWSGPRKWTTSPYLMSIFTLLMRIGKNKWLPKQLFNLSHEDMVRQLAIAAKTNENNDATQLSKTIRDWDPFMTLYKDLFGDLPRKHHWDTSHLNGGGDRAEGIQKLITGTTHYKSLHKEYFRLKKEKNLK
jgi:hypothetical protein